MGKFIPFAVVALALVLYCSFNCDNFDPTSINNKRVLITGASTGIGEQLAYQYAKLGAKIVITARRQHHLDKVVQKCRELGASKVESVVADMAIPKDRSKVIKETEKHLQGLDHLVLNHAVYDMNWWTSSPDNLTTLQDYLNINFLSYVDLTSKAMQMLTASKGNIGVVSSVAGKIANAAFAPYVTTKFALQGFFSSFRQELLFKETGISVTLCVLGFIDTEKAVNLIQSAHPDLDVKKIAASAEDTALAILKAVTKGVYELYYPKMASVLVNAHKLFPGYVEQYIASQNKK